MNSENIDIEKILNVFKIILFSDFLPNAIDSNQI